MIDFNLVKNDCPEHGTEWFLDLFWVPRTVHLIDKIYFGLLGFLGDPTFMFDFGYTNRKPKGFWSKVPLYFNLSEQTEEKIYNLQLWLVTNKIASLKDAYKEELDIQIAIDQDFAATLEPDWVASEMANEALSGVENISDIGWS